MIAVVTDSVSGVMAGVRVGNCPPTCPLNFGPSKIFLLSETFVKRCKIWGRKTPILETIQGQN